jgi:L-histidine Nalpha-methyltransferase
MRATKLFPISAIAGDVREGLTRASKSLPPKLFYDTEGSALFDQITRLPEYYPTRTELAILQRRAPEIVKSVGHIASLVELGSGNAEKTTTLLRAFQLAKIEPTYVPFDISRAALAEAESRIGAQLPGLRVEPRLGDLSHDLDFLRSTAAPRLVVYLGSSIGNLTWLESVELLRRVWTTLGPDDTLLLGADLIKPASILIPAYADSSGVTERFNKNVLARINRELGAEFDLESFRHVAVWNKRASRVEMHLESACKQSVYIEDLDVAIDFEEGERIHTENSHKYTLDQIERLLNEGGFGLRRAWRDERKWFTLVLGVPE